MTPEVLIAAAYAAGWDAETPNVTGAEAYLADAVEASARYNLRRMQNLISVLDPEGPNQAQK